MDNEVRKTISFKVSEEDYWRYKNAGLDMRYANLSQFVRAAIEEKIKRFEKSVS